MNGAKHGGETGKKQVMDQRDAPYGKSKGALSPKRGGFPKRAYSKEALQAVRSLKKAAD